MTRNTVCDQQVVWWQASGISPHQLAEQDWDFNDGVVLDRSNQHLYTSLAALLCVIFMPSDCCVVHLLQLCVSSQVCVCCDRGQQMQLSCL